MKPQSLHCVGRIMLLTSGFVASFGAAVSGQEVELNLRTKLESLKSGILNPFGSPSGMATDGSLPSPIRPSLGDPFAMLQSRVSDASQASLARRAPYYEIPGTDNKRHRIHFSVTPQSGDFSFAAIKSKANSVANAEKKSQPETYLWDDLWHKQTLEASGNKYLLLFWHDWTGNTGEWAAIKNTPQAWYVYSSQYPDKLWIPGNAKQLKFGKTIPNTNRRVDIDVHNPDNTGGYTSNDILFGFGW